MPSFALKRLRSASKSEFEREVEMLKAFTPRNHCNLVKLLCTFHYKGEYYLLFPFAESNLRQHWQSNPTPGLSVDISQWVLLQCKAMSSALHLIHTYRTTFEHTPLPEINDNDRIYGRHGDIKPENILLLREDVAERHGKKPQHVLLIADFGLMDLHRRLTRSLIAPDKINGSPSYEPPELQVGREVSRAYDIWSLGCVFLEMIIWLTSGWTEVEAFTQARADTSMNGLIDYRFYTITGTQATIRVSVQRWIERLQDHPNSSTFLRDFLEIVSEEMLVVEPTKRIRCGPLNERLKCLNEKSQNDPKYFEKLIVV
jgi:serine/threonine protein kinase